MADVFISYSQKDRLLVEGLAAELEAHGWTVWFDRDLSAGEAYRDGIAEELAAARAVLVVWTPNSIASDFVRAEAGRAKADGRLIPLKTADVDYHDIPLPFGEIHTEPTDNLDLVRAAIARLLARPAAQPDVFAQLRGALKGDVLFWFGLIGASITLFTSMSSLITLSDWASWFVTNWTEIVHAVWGRLFALLGISLQQPWPFVLTTMLFLLSALFASYRRYAREKKLGLFLGNSVTGLSLRGAILILLGSQLIGVLVLLYVGVDTSHEDEGTASFASLLNNFSTVLIVSSFAFCAGITLMATHRAYPGSLLEKDWRKFKQPLLLTSSVILSYLLVFLLIVLMGFDPAAKLVFTLHELPRMEQLELARSLVWSLIILGSLTQVFLLVALVAVPAHVLTRQLVFAFIGLGILCALNELAKLNLGQYLSV